MMDAHASAQKSRFRVENLHVVLRGSGEAILKDVNFELHPGEIFALVGESGSGKSVSSLASMRLLPDALSIKGGKALLENEDLFHFTETQMQKIRGQKVAMIFQNAMTALNPVQTVGQQIAETLKLHTNLAGDQLKTRLIHSLAEVGIPNPEQRLKFYPHQLSGGQQQRVMIAIALACEPDILIADEPTTALDVTVQKQILNLIRKLTQTRQLAVLLITHDMGVVYNTADRVAVMYKGQIIESGTIDGFFHNPQHDYSKKLIHSLPDLSHYNTSDSSNELLKLDDVKVWFPIKKGVLQRTIDHTRAVDGVSLSIQRGETYALVGESGSGKSTLGRAILRLENLHSGEIYFEGKPIGHYTRKEMLALRNKIQVIFQNPHSSMNPRMTIGNIIEEGLLSLRTDLNATDRQERIDTLLESVQLPKAFIDRYPHELSGGQLQRVAIARALAVEPDLIVCDEPTSALDVSIRAEVLKLLQDLQNEFGVSLLFITHDLSIVPRLEHHVGVMKSGKLVEQGSAEKILTQPKESYTQELLASVPQLDKK